MSSADPVLHLLAGPNGAGKTTFVERVLRPATHLPFVNADVIAASTWPGAEEAHGHEASRIAARERTRFIEERLSFISETVFSHPSKVDLLKQARDAGFHTTLHVILVPVELSAARVTQRVSLGGHSVPETKIREGHQRLWGYVSEAIGVVDEAFVYDNSRATTPFRRVASYRAGTVLTQTSWPSWAPSLHPPG